MDTRVIRLNEQAKLNGRFANEAKEVYRDLLNRGYTKDDIKLLISAENLIKDSGSQNATATKEKNEALSNLIGTVAGIIVGIGLAAGLVIAGFDYAGLMGAGAAGTIGVIIGFIMIPSPSKETLEIVEPKTADDSIILRVNMKNKHQAEYFEDEWRTHKGKMVVAPK